MDDWTVGRRAHLEMTGGAQVVDVVSVVVPKDDVVDRPFNLRCRNSAGTARDVSCAARPRVLHTTVIGREPRRNCDHRHIGHSVKPSSQPQHKFATPPVREFTKCPAAFNPLKGRGVNWLHFAIQV